MFSRLIFIVVSVLFMIAPVLAPASEEDFKVVVNESNSLTTISVTELSGVFLKKSKTGPNGRLLVPIDQVPTSEVREAFSKAIHGVSTSSVNALWNRVIFSGQGVPPVALASDTEVLAAVRADPNAIGYVKLSTPIGEGVKVLKVTDR